MTRIIAIVSQKGGVGKTALAHNLGYELGQAGKRVLLVDFDPQADLTTCNGLTEDEERATVYEAMMEPHEAALCIEPINENLDLLTADEDLSGAELEFSKNQSQRNTRLRAVMDNVADEYDYILIDCPPSLGFFTANALVAANQIIVPLQCEHLAHKALNSLLGIVAKSQRQNPQLRVAGVVLTFFDRRNSLSERIAGMARKELGNAVLKTEIPRNVAVAYASEAGVPVGQFKSRSKGALAYKELAKEIMSRD